jgi:hypothetical protein
MQTLIVILVVLASALYAAARLLPGAWIERLLRAGETFHPRMGRGLRRFAGRPRRAPGADAETGCSSCSAAATHTPAGRRPLTKS